MMLCKWFKKEYRILIYIGLRCTNDRIYALYSEKEKMDESDYSTSNLIYTFDWEGHLLTKYEPDCRIISFDVDTSTQPSNKPR
jgi:hypothetical protein